MVNEKIHDLHVPVDKEIFGKLETIKVYYGIKNNTEIIRFLITKEYRVIEKWNNIQYKIDLTNNK